LTGGKIPNSELGKYKSFRKKKENKTFSLFFFLPPKRS
jgi:hypothetical protein